MGGNEHVQPLRERLRTTAADALLDAAESVMIAKGYEKATMQDIAAAAGCAVGTVYLHFKTKEDLFRGVLRRHGNTMQARTAEALAGADTAADKLKAMVLLHLEWAQEHIAIVNLICTSLPMRYYDFIQSMDSIMECEGETFEAMNLQIIREGQKEGQIRSDIAAEALTELFCGVLLTYLDQFAAKPDQFVLGERMRMLWGFLAAGLGVKG